uniref:39S ribosomal protein L17, mitochondrial n=1 Tax=Angiostrongylus cantonensis TaxID=6313 RepID=A0A0K0D745_ANGCA
MRFVSFLFSQSPLAALIAKALRMNVSSIRFVAQQSAISERRRIQRIPLARLQTAPYFLPSNHSGGLEGEQRDFLELLEKNSTPYAKEAAVLYFRLTLSNDPLWRLPDPEQNKRLVRFMIIAKP